MTPPPENGAPAWATTFGDLMSLMLTFFVLLTSFATLDAHRFEAMAKSLQAGFGNGGGAELVLIGAPAGGAQAPAPAAGAEPGAGAEAALAARIGGVVRARKLERVVEVETTPRGVVLRTPGQLLFAEGSDELRGEALPVLHEIAALLKDVPGDVSIEGHADDGGKGGTAGFELSCARALAALRELVGVEGLDAKRLRATGFGDVRPLFANSGPLARERNRRVEFVLLRPALEGEPREPAELGSVATNGDGKAR